MVERTIDVRGVRTHLFEGGDAGPPLVYLHGILTGSLWLDFHVALAKQFHVYAPDLPGFGLSERPSWMRDMSDYVLWMRDLLDVLGLKKSFVVGHSIGGWTAAELAVWYPERVSKLVLTNALGLRVKGTPRPDVFALAPEELIGTCFEDWAAAVPLMPSEFGVDYMFSQYRQFATLAALTWNPGHDPKLERRLERVSCPTLVLWGAGDRMIPPAYGEAYHSCIAGSEHVQIAGTGHMPMLEKTEEWSGAIRHFLSREAVTV